MLKIKGAGQDPAKADQYQKDEIVYLLDCSDLLAQHELITSIDTPDNSALIFSEIRSRRGTIIQIKVASNVLAAPYTDNKIYVRFKTSAGSQKTALFQLRVYR